MSAVDFLSRNPRKALGGLATVLAATGVAVGSGADFTAQSANPSNTFSAGALTMSNSKDGQAILSASNLKPGASESGTVTIKNTGSVGGSFKVTQEKTAASTGAKSDLFNKLNVRITDGSATPVYDGPMSALSSRGLGGFAPNDAKTYTFAVSWPSGSDDNDYAGAKDLVVKYTWDALQS